MKILFLSSAVAGQLPRKCETVSSSVSQAGQRLVAEFGAIVVPVVDEMGVDLYYGGHSVSASDSHVSMCVFVRYPGVVAE